MMSYMPSTAYVAEAIFTIGADTTWEDASPEDRDANMMLAKVAIDAMLSWQAKHRGDGSARYCFEPVNDSTEDAYAAWGIFDRKDGLTQPIGVVHDPLLAQQIIDDLNKRNVFKGPLP